MGWDLRGAGTTWLRVIWMVIRTRVRSMNECRVVADLEGLEFILYAHRSPNIFLSR